MHYCMDTSRSSRLGKDNCCIHYISYIEKRIITIKGKKGKVMEKNRPRGREKNVSGSSKGVHKRGEGLNTGPVGNTEGYSSKGNGVKGNGTKGNGVRGNGVRGNGTRGNGKSPLSIILIILTLLLGGGGGISMLSGNNAGTEQSSSGGYGTSLFGNGSIGSGTATGTWSGGSSNTGKLDKTVAKGSRAKRTEILDNQNDTVTIMVYMCGTDLESNSGMATADLQEMLAADLGDSVNLLIYTGGCTGWKNNVISSKVNQIYQVKDGKLICLEKNAGTASMTDPDTLTDFVKWCKKNYPANRNELIFWDHGGGSLSGYGYDQKYPNSGSMSLAGINEALKNTGMTFDFIGFDACLMATMENALMLCPYADYLIASEETEPGVGWYYTNWLTEFAADPSKATIEVGQKIVDDFVDVCSQKCKGQQTTLSVIDLAELEYTVPDKLTAFSQNTSQLIQNESYKTVADARNQTREFARSSGIDQVDLVHLAKNMGTDEGKALAEALLGAVKYNRTCSSMTNAYGISIYFPYKKVSSVDQAVKTYKQIGMDEEYARCIQEFASLEVSGQAVSGGTSSPLPSLLGTLGEVSGSVDSEMMMQILGTLLSGDSSNIFGLTSSNMDFLSGRALDQEQTADYLVENQFDSSQLVWQEDEDGNKKICLSEEQWSLVHDLELNMFYDDGEGYIDLGLDNVFEFDEEGNLLGESDRTWLAINGQPVAYYYLDTVDDGENYTITGRVPAMLNGERVNLILVFDNENPNGYIAGARIDYVDGETETIAKGMSALQPGDQLDFICDYYSYEGDYQNSYYLGETMTVEEKMTISNVDVGDGAVQVTWKFTDIYNQQYWTPVLEQ